MAVFSDDLEQQLMNFLFTGASITALTSANTKLWCALHTADPGEAGTQGANEGGYPQYARVQVLRSSTAFQVLSGQASPFANIDFPANTSTSTGTFTHLSVGVTSASTAGVILMRGAIIPPAQYSQNTTVRLSTDSIFSLD